MTMNVNITQFDSQKTSSHDISSINGGWKEFPSGLFSFDVIHFSAVWSF